MSKISALAVAAVLITAVGFVLMDESSINNLRVGKEPQTVPYVDVNSYLGAWYEQAVIPYFWENGCSKTKAVYSVNPDKTLRVDNSCEKNGKLHENVGKAIPEDSTNAKLKVEFVQTLDIGAQYWIVRLAKDYSYSVVSSPNYRYLWILYRQPVMPEPLYNQIVADLKKDDFPVEKLVRTKQ